MKITDVSIISVTGKAPDTEFPSGDRQITRMDVYADKSTDNRQARIRKGGPTIGALYVEISTDSTVSGIFGPIDETQAFIITAHLRAFLIGKDPIANELLLDQMLRINRHGRSGLFMTGVSPVDCALWDLKGKAYEKPVYRLLGGPTRSAVPAYASMLGYSIEPGAAAATAAEFKARGYGAQKWFFRFGPAHAEEGRLKNLQMAEAVRAAVGPDYLLMFDAFMGWDVAYARKMLAGLAAVDPHWVEEPIPPERIGEFARLKRTSPVPIATGEHVYTRWQVKELLVRNAVDFVQTDPDWTGGITELAKICALCSSFEVPVVAHGHSLLAALHTAASQSPAVVPMVEYLIRHQENKQHFHSPIYRPENGEIRLPELPGLGIVLEDEKIEERKAVSFQLT